MKILEYIKDNILIFDGAMGTMLQKNGLNTDEIPEVYNLTQPNVLRGIHREYVAAGADVITANTFQANRKKLGEDYTVEDIVVAGVKLAKESGANYVALDMGPLGLLEPIGDISLNEAYDIFKEQAIAGEQAGADCIILETFSSLQEVKIALLAAKENTRLPIFATLTYDRNGRTFLGCEPIGVTATLQSLGISGLGVNCSLGPNELAPVVESILKYAEVPVIVQANMGLPTIENGIARYSITDDEYVESIMSLMDKGVAIIGGCCGTTPSTIKLIKERLEFKAKMEADKPRFAVVSSGTASVVIDNMPILVGECLSSNDNLDDIIDIAMDFADDGIEILKVSEKAECSLEDIVKELQAVVSASLILESGNMLSLENAVRAYNGRPILSFDTNNNESIKIAKKYGTLVLCESIENAMQLVYKGFSAKDIVIKAGRNEIIGFSQE